MGMTAIIAAGLLVSLPFWLPPVVVRLRMKIFTRINGEETLQLPNDSFGPAEFRQIYEHQGVRGRSRGARLSDLFWYWLSPGPQWHQEHLEDGPRYELLSGLTRDILARPRGEVESLVERCATATPGFDIRASWRWVRLRDLVMPFWSRFFFELLFGQRCSDESAHVVEAHANDVATALKCCSLRHMRKRERLTELLMAKIQAGEFPYTFPVPLGAREKAYFLQGAFFTTGVIQMSDATAHLLMVLAQHPDVQDRLAAHPEDHRYYNRVVSETLRMYPLFGIAHRIVTTEVEIGDNVIDPGSIVCFNYPEYHNRGLEDPQDFRPERWERCPAKRSNYMPFGAAANRPCPAQGLALTAMRRITLLLLPRFRFSSTARHERALPNRGPCLLVDRHGKSPRRETRRLLLLMMRARDRWEDAWRGLSQLVFGTIMVVDARRQRLCENHFREEHTSYGACGRAESEI